MTTIIIAGMAEIFLIALMVISTIRANAQAKNATKMMSLMSEDKRTELILRELKKNER